VAGTRDGFATAKSGDCLRGRWYAATLVDVHQGYRTLTGVQGQFRGDANFFKWIGEALLLEEARQNVSIEAGKFARPSLSGPSDSSTAPK